jgi:FAD:protein FMN transferase
VTRVALALEAMATRFELVLGGHDESRLRAAGEEALEEIRRGEARLSRFLPSSEIAWINARAGRAAVPLEARTFALLHQCQELCRLTDGAFDITVGPLMRAWGFVRGRGRLAAPGEVERARALVGMDGLELDAAAGTARLLHEGMELDLGAVGKGHALDRAIAVLEEHGIERALLHGGTSSVHVIGRPRGGSAWDVRWRPPRGRPRLAPLSSRRPALSVSASHGKAFLSEGRLLGHVLDPRLGRPAGHAAAACVVGASSTVCDALSTALLVHGERWSATLAERFPGYTGWAVGAPRLAADGASHGDSEPLYGSRVSSRKSTLGRVSVCVPNTWPWSSTQ